MFSFFALFIKDLTHCNHCSLAAHCVVSTQLNVLPAGLQKILGWDIEKGAISKCDENTIKMIRYSMIQKNVKAKAQILSYYGITEQKIIFEPSTIPSLGAYHKKMK